MLDAESFRGLDADRSPSVPGSPGEGSGTFRSSCTWMSIRARCAAGCQISSNGPATELPTARPLARRVNHAKPDQHRREGGEDQQHREHLAHEGRS